MRLWGVWNGLYFSAWLGYFELQLYQKVSNSTTIPYNPATTSWDGLSIVLIYEREARVRHDTTFLLTRLGTTRHPLGHEGPDM